MHTNSMEESAAWGAGYDAGQAGMLKSIETAELLATKRESERIIELLQEHFYAVCSASKNPDKERYVLGWQDAIALIKGEK